MDEMLHSSPFCRSGKRPFSYVTQQGARRQRFLSGVDSSWVQKWVWVRWGWRPWFNSRDMGMFLRGRLILSLFLSFSRVRERPCDLASQRETGAVLSGVPTRPRRADFAVVSAEEMTSVGETLRAIRLETTAGCFVFNCGGEDKCRR